MSTLSNNSGVNEMLWVNQMKWINEQKGVVILSAYFFPHFEILTQMNVNRCACKNSFLTNYSVTTILQLKKSPESHLPESQMSM